jgi:hypothetical protein
MPIARRPLSFAAALVLRFGLASGCSGSGANENPPDPTTEQLRQVGQRVPAFGGVQWDDDRLVVFVLKEEKVGVAREVLRNIFGRRRPPSICKCARRTERGRRRCKTRPARCCRSKR